MTAPFAQRSLGKTKSRFALYAKALSLSLLFLPKGRWHKVPEGISHGFIRFIGGKRIYTAQYIVGLRFPRVMYFCVHSPSESLVLRVLLVSPRFDGRRVRSAEPNADTCGQPLSHAPHDSSLYTKEPWEKRFPTAFPLHKGALGKAIELPPCVKKGERAAEISPLV